MGLITISQVHAWKPWKLQTAALGLARQRASFDAVVADTRRAMSTALESWTGPAASAASGHANREHALGKAVAEVVSRAATVLDEGSQMLTTAREAVIGAVRAAEADGCRVSNAGDVSPPPAPPVVAGASAPTVFDLQAQLIEAVALAQRHERAIRAALVAAQAADDAVSLRLRSIQLPDALQSQANEISERLDLSGVLGPAAGFNFPEGWNPWERMHAGSTNAWLTMVQGVNESFPVTRLTGTNALDLDQATGYYGGGFMTGPDGRDYPLVVPQLNENGIAYGADASLASLDLQPGSVDTLNGADDGWHTVATNSGVTKFGVPISAGSAALGAIAIQGGAAKKPDFQAERQNSDDLQLSPTGYPFITEYDPTARPSIPQGDPRGNPVDNPPLLGDDPPPGTHPERLARTGSVIDVTIGGVNAVDYMVNHDDGHIRAYEVTFQHNDDGRSRALLQTYRVGVDMTGNNTINPAYGWVDPEGDFREELMEFRHTDSEISNPDPKWYVAQRHKN